MRRVRVFSVLFLLSLSAVSCSTVAKYKVPDTKGLSFNEAVALFNTPEKVNGWLARNFKWAAVAGSTFITPQEVFKTKRGTCITAANFAAYCLDRAGYEVEVVIATSNKEFRSRRWDGEPVASHAVCAYKKNGRWRVAGDTRGQTSPRRFSWGAGPFRSLKEVAEYAIEPHELIGYNIGRICRSFLKRGETEPKVELNWPK